MRYLPIWNKPPDQFRVTAFEPLRRKQATLGYTAYYSIENWWSKVSLSFHGKKFKNEREAETQLFEIHAMYIAINEGLDLSHCNIFMKLD